MSEKKGIFNGLFGKKEKSGCCNMEIAEEVKEKSSCCDMQIVEEPEEENCCGDTSGCCEEK